MKRDIIKDVVNQDLCIGCGICSGLSKGALSMEWNNEGFLVPEQKKPFIDQELLKICPFNPIPEESVKTEDELADIFLENTKNKDKSIGKYESAYVGYSKEFRDTSSSGGIATYIFSELFKRNIVDAIIVVKQGVGSDHYQYGWIHSLEDLKQSSKTRYFPVTLADQIKKIDAFDGKVAIVGVGCFLKGVRLLQYYYPSYKEKIVFLTGIVCGGLKSRFFSDYLSNKALKTREDYHDPEYRVKDPKSSATDYSFESTSKKNIKKSIKMSALNDMWGTGYFKANACDLCEDVTTELADISLGDAWIDPYKKDGRGTNIVITRSKIAEKLIKEGLKNNLLSLEDLPLDKLKQSQSGSFNHRQLALGYRIKKFNNKGILTPPKRNRNIKKISFLFKQVQFLRMKTRRESLNRWKKYQEADLFDRKIFPLLKTLGLFTKLYRKFK